MDFFTKLIVITGVITMSLDNYKSENDIELDQVTCKEPDEIVGTVEYGYFYVYMFWVPCAMCKCVPQNEYTECEWLDCNKSYPFKVSLYALQECCKLAPCKARQEINKLKKLEEIEEKRRNNNWNAASISLLLLLIVILLLLFLHRMHCFKKKLIIQEPNEQPPQRAPKPNSNISCASYACAI